MMIIFDVVMCNFCVVVDILEVLQVMWLDMVVEVCSGLVGCLCFGLVGGYNNVILNVGVCLLISVCVEFLMVENVSGVELCCMGVDWMMLEGMLFVEVFMM